MQESILQWSLITTSGVIHCYHSESSNCEGGYLENELRHIPTRVGRSCGARECLRGDANVQARCFEPRERDGISHGRVAAILLDSAAHTVEMQLRN